MSIEEEELKVKVIIIIILRIKIANFYSNYEVNFFTKLLWMFSGIVSI